MIGIYDSGVGGLSVWRELIALMPSESYLYVSDGGHCPYGPKPADYIIARAHAITDFLIKNGADLIVVACNTATAAAIEWLRSHYSIPFIGMEPAIKPAALHSKTGVVGVLATEGTLKGKLYLNTLANFATDVNVIEKVGTGLVEAVEEGKINTPGTKALLHRYIDPMIEAGADHIVLGCTHYPFLTDTIKRIVGDKVVIVNPAPAVAKQTRKIAESIPLRNPDGDHTSTFFSTGPVDILRKIATDIDPSLSPDNFKTNIYI